MGRSLSYEMRFASEDNVTGSHEPVGNEREGNNGSEPTTMKSETVLLPEIADRYVRDGWWVNRSLIEYFDEAVARNPDKIAIVAPDGVQLTYRETAQRADCIAANLAARGVQAGQVVSIQLPNCAETVLIHLAASRLGAVTNPLLPSYRTKELSYILRFARTVAVFIPKHYRGFDFPEMYAELRGQLPDLRSTFVVDANVPQGFDNYADLLRPAVLPAPRIEVAGNDVTALIFTSGTESTPKGVMHSHNTTLYATLTMAKLLGLTENDVVWMPSPVGHGTGFLWGIRQAITLGSKIVLQDLWDPDEALALIERERCTFTLSATPFVSMLLDAPSIGRRDASSFRFFACAGAPIPRQVGIDANAKLGCKLIGMWGMSECFVGTASPPSDPDERLWGSDGKAMPGGEVAIFDESREKRLSAGEVGELAVRGPFVALGYFNDPVRTQQTFTEDGWLFTNDLAVMDADGYIRIVGRKKDIINRGGLKISAREIEDLLSQAPAIRQAAVVPVPDDRLGEKSCAFLVLREGKHLSFNQLTDYLEARGLAKYKLPEYMVLIDGLPMTPSGKIQKFKLVEGFTRGDYRAAERS